MERLHYPIALNPNAKYLPNSISNVLYSIQKFDQSTLAWPTCQRKRNVPIGKAFTSPPEVPLAGTATCVIQKRRQCASRSNAKEVQKNTFYQILQASQDQPCIQQSSRIKRKSTDPKFKSDFKDDSIYNDIYDIVRSHTQYKRLPQLEKQPEQQKPFSLNTPAVEVYKVRPFATEIKKPRSKTANSTAKTNKLREKTNELSDSKRTTHQSKSKLTESKSSRRYTNKLREKTNELLVSKRTTHQSKPKLAESKSSRKNTNKHREKTNQLSDSKRTTNQTKPKLTASKSSRKKTNKLQEKTNEILNSERTTPHFKPKSSQNQFLKYETRENKQKGNSKSEKHKATQQLWPFRGRGADRIPQRSIYNDQFNVGSEIKSNFSTTQLPDPDGQKIQEVSTEEQGNMDEKPEQKTERASDTKRNSNEESGRRKRKSKLKLKLFNANNTDTIYVVQGRNSKGLTGVPLLNKRSGTEIYRIKEMKLNPFKEQEDFSTLKPQKTDSYILGRSKMRFNSNRTREKKISTIREKSLVESTTDTDTTANNIQKNFKSTSVKSNEQEIQSSTAPVKEEIVSKPRKMYPINRILNVINESRSIGNPDEHSEILVRRSSSSSSQISSQKQKPKDIFEENTAKLKRKTKTTTNVSQIKDKSRFFRHNSAPPTPTNSIETEIEALPVYPYEEHSDDNEDETSYRSGSIYSADRRTLERKSLLERLNSKIRKINLDTTSQMYQQRLFKVKQFLNRHSMIDNTDTSSIDIEGIPDSDLLMYPYTEIYENKTTVTKVNQPKVSEAIKENSKPILRPPDDTRKIKNEKPVRKKSACIICRTIRGNHGAKEAPFMEQMRKEKRRRELLTYRAKIEEPHIKSFNILPKDPKNKTKAINMHDLSKKELYTLESRINIFGTASSMSSFPKKSNLITFPSET
uniref:Uncharacterized protein n=1 Tax=Drosophila melanogaster TaxID=7227 RepID=Q9VWA5_DROME|nr:uncharacterized protein Dmel_CG32228 [Drosophila melanogaster]AAF49043.2 uncharacterized protein Dmel_CG32228 [Drosophila melanogaster]|eukprot:NP_730504.1 uncharacterized protein Dmel_CG32228 [Drosophila melanogaster]